MNGIECEYEYKPSWPGIILVAAFFGSSSILLARVAARNDRGLIINGIISLGPDAATAFYWFLAACGVGFVAMAASAMYGRLAFRQRIAFGSAVLTMPAAGWSWQESEIPYRDIRDLSIVSGSGQRFLHITHVGGKRRIAASMLPSKASFDEVCELLAAKVRECQITGERDTRSRDANDGDSGT